MGSARLQLVLVSSGDLLSAPGSCSPNRARTARGKDLDLFSRSAGEHLAQPINFALRHALLRPELDCLRLLKLDRRTQGFVGNTERISGGGNGVTGATAAVDDLGLRRHSRLRLSHQLLYFVLYGRIASQQYHT